MVEKNRSATTMSVVVKNRRRAKAVERSLAKRLGGRRVGILGQEDIDHPLFSIEVKSRAKFVATNWMEQIIKSCKDGKIPIVIVHITNQRHDNDLVIIRLKDFEKLVGEGLCLQNLVQKK